MAEVFISYSRKDKDFVRKLSDALDDRKRKPWVDWKDIPLTAQWQQEIFRNIESADSFVFVISPDSVSSSNCRREIDYAVENHKKMIPIFYRSVPDELVPDSLNRFQRVGFDQDDHFDVTFDALIKALDTDLEWTQAHTRLLIWAKDWERGGKDNSSLLRGKDLTAAEQWVAKYADRDPKPTTLQLNYIFTSHQEETATAQRLAAEYKARELAVLSLQSIAEDPERSILLAMHAVGATLRLGLHPVQVALAALHRAVLSSRVRHTLRGHSGFVNAISFSPDGDRLLTCSGDCSARLWDAINGQELLTVHSDGQISAVGFHPNGQCFATAGYDLLAKVWDASDGHELLILRGHQQALSGVAFSPDGHQIATSSCEDEVKLWNSVQGTEALSIHCGSEMVLGLNYSSDGRRLLTAGYDGTTRVWDAVAGDSLLTVWTNHGGQVSAAVFSPDGTRLASAGIDGTARLFDASSGKELLVLRGHSDQASAVAFSPDGKRVATASNDNTARVWDTENGRELQIFRGHSHPLSGVVFSPDGKLLATASQDGTAKVWAADVLSELPALRGHKDWVFRVVFSPDGTLLATASRDGTAKVWDGDTGHELLTLSGHNGVVLAVAFSPEGTRIATAGADGTVRVWDATKGLELFRLGGKADCFRDLASALNNSDVDWFALTGKVNSVTDLSFSPNGKCLATVSDDGAARVWDATSGKELLRVPGLGSFSRLAYRQDSKVLATGSFERVKLWDAIDGRGLSTLVAKDARSGAIAFSPDGKLVIGASADNSLTMWDAATGDQLLRIQEHTAPINSVAFSPDGKWIATASDDETTRVWDSASGQEVLILPGHNDKVTDAAFSPDGRRLATASHDGTVQMCTLDVCELLRLAHARVTRDLTSDECLRYFQSKTCPPLP